MPHDAGKSWWSVGRVVSFSAFGLLAFIACYVVTAGSLLGVVRMHGGKVPSSGSEDGTAVGSAGLRSECKWSRYQGFPVTERAPNVAKLLYVKVPKSGSTTVSALLRRYADHREMDVLLPLYQKNFFDEASFKDSMVAQNLSKPDALLSHLNYNQSLVDKILGQGSEAPFRVVSIREPVDRTMSSYFYARTLRTTRPDLDFACNKDVDDYAKWVEDCGMKSQMRYATPIDWPDSDARNFEKIVDHYDHIFVTDTMTKSILALAPKLGLSLPEMLVCSIKTSTRQVEEDGVDGAMMQDLTKRIKDRVEKENSDNVLYKMAMERLDREFAALSPEMRNSLSDLETMTTEMAAVCIPDDEFPLFDNCIETWVNANVRCK